MKWYDNGGFVKEAYAAMHSVVIIRKSRSGVAYLLEGGGAALHVARKKVKAFWQHLAYDALQFCGKLETNKGKSTGSHILTVCSAQCSKIWPTLGGHYPLLLTCMPLQGLWVQKPIHLQGWMGMWYPWSWSHTNGAASLQDSHGFTYCLAPGKTNWGQRGPTHIHAVRSSEVTFVRGCKMQIIYKQQIQYVPDLVCGAT